MNFEVQEFTLFQGWTNTWSDEHGNPSVFLTEADAQIELDGFLKDMQDAVDSGDMQDAPSRDQYRIVCISHKNHRLYPEFTAMINDDAVFAGLYDDTYDDFHEWVRDYEIDSDIQGDSHE